MSARYPGYQGLTRAELLREMGLGRQWCLRAQASVESATQEALGTPAADDRRQEGMAGAAAAASAVLQPPANRAAAIAAMGWEQLQQSVTACRACGLCQARRQAVLGVGDVKADWLFIGEGPGAEEDARGEPFVGPAGQLLDAMLEAIDLRRGKNVYIANAVKCRPPGNRTPEAAEMATCAPYLQRQIALIRPRLIVLLGRAAAHSVLGEAGSLASLRGKPFAYRETDSAGAGIPVVVSYHPAYLLRTMSDKAKAWEDLCRARALLRAAKSEEPAEPPSH